MDHELQVLSKLESEETSSQRQLSQATGISLGKINYILHALMEKGWVKIGNFKRNPKKISYIYKLTPKGIEAKAKLTVTFIQGKISEYNDLRERLKNQLSGLKSGGVDKVSLECPDGINNLLKDILKELRIDLVPHEKAQKVVVALGNGRLRDTVNRFGKNRIFLIK